MPFPGADLTFLAEVLATGRRKRVDVGEVEYAHGEYRHIQTNARYVASEHARTLAAPQRRSDGGDDRGDGRVDLAADRASQVRAVHPVLVGDQRSCVLGGADVLEDRSHEAPHCGNGLEANGDMGPFAGLELPVHK